MGLVRNFAELLQCRCTVPSAIDHCYHNEAGQQTIKASSMPCSGATGPCKHSVAFMPQDWWNRQIKRMKSVSIGSYQYKHEVNGEVFPYLWVILMYFSLQSRRIPAVLEWVSQLFWKLLGQVFDSCYLAVKQEFESIFQAVKHWNSEIWSWNIDFRPKYIRWSQCSKFFSAISTTESFQILGC